MLTAPMAKKDTQGFFLRPERDLVNRLEKLKDEFEKGSANQVAVEVIKDYIDFWAEAERAKKKVRVLQEAQFSRMRHEILTQPLVKAETEITSKPLPKRKTR